MSDPHAASSSPFRQPTAVWAVAFACVVSFMGIGLVDPILPALAKQLHATPSNVELLFTSYLLVTAVAMLITGFVSSRIGAKPTLVIALVLIVVFSALAGSSDTIGGIIGFRAGWGLGNALFIATSLAVIIAAASGGFAGAIILYETALGIGIGLGPLLGGLLGGVSWRAPFFGVTVLMSIALIATVVFVKPIPRPTRKSSITEPLTALRQRGLATMSVTALFYNWGFFTLLAFTPFVMNLSIHDLGYTFTGWGILVAIFAVFVAPRAQRRFGTPATLYVNLTLLAVDLVVIAACTSSKTILIVAVIVSGAFVGLNNTLTTQAVMLVSTVERPTASAAYGFVRFIGGGLAPYVAAKLADHFNVHVPFYLGAVAVMVAIVVLATGHRLLVAAERETVERPSAEPRPETQELPLDRRPVLLALGETPSPSLLDTGRELAKLLSAPVEILHVLETEVVMEDAVEAEPTSLATDDESSDTLRALTAAGVPASRHVLRVVGDHGDVGRRIAAFARERQARMIVIGAPRHQTFASLFDTSATIDLLRDTPCDVCIVHGDGIQSQLECQPGSGKHQVESSLVFPR